MCVQILHDQILFLITYSFASYSTLSQNGLIYISRYLLLFEFPLINTKNVLNPTTVIELIGINIAATRGVIVPDTAKDNPMRL